MSESSGERSVGVGLLFHCNGYVRGVSRNIMERVGGISLLSFSVIVHDNLLPFHFSGTQSMCNH